MGERRITLQNRAGLHPIQVFTQKCEIKSLWMCKSMNESCTFVNGNFSVDFINLHIISSQ